MNLHAPLLHVVREDEALPDIPKEPKRDWEFGVLTGHRLRVVLYLAGTMALLYLIQSLLWPNPNPPTTLVEHLWTWMDLLWVTAVIPGTLGLLGELNFKHPTDLDQVQPIGKLVSWRIVSRGDNVEVLLSTVRRIQTEMKRAPLFPYVIEVVTDTISPVIPWPNEDVRLIPVPLDYQTPNNSRFKARGLHYAMLHSPISDDAWIVHLDEETQPTLSGIKGIAKMIREEEQSKRYRIGQGAILYHRAWKKYPILTLADNVRTGDDFARFHFQHKLGVTVFGLHGSYIVVRNSVEKATGGFDFGPKGDITEDAFWAMQCMEQGYRARWVEGYLEEQSCMSAMDFLKQRRRWWQGLALVALFAPVKLRWRICLGINTALWALAPFSMMYTIAHYFWGFAVDPWVQFFANYSYGTFVVLYFMGLKANLDEGIDDPKLKRVVRPAAYALQALLTFFPFFAFMESAGVLWAILKPANGFHVVKK